jgi:hypothetical protein
MVAATAALSVSGGAAMAAEFHLEFPAGEACSFPLAIDATGGDHRVTRTFVDADGNPVRVIDAGRGYELTLTNLSNGSTLTLRPSGGVIRTEYNDDGTLTQSATGHILQVLFPTDIPEGPSTTLYVGRIVTDIDTSGVFTMLLPVTGREPVDVCEALS